MGRRNFCSQDSSYKILDVVKAISSNGKFKIVGIRPGEKIHEEMITQTDSINTIEFDKYFVIIPSLSLWDIDEFISRSNDSPGVRCKTGFSYNSNNNEKFLTVEDLKSLIEEHK